MDRRVKAGWIGFGEVNTPSEEFHAACGEAMQPAPWEECGWTAPAPQLPGLEVRLDHLVEEFAQKVASQHTIVAYRDITDALTQWAALLGVQMV